MATALYLVIQYHSSRQNTCSTFSHYVSVSGALSPPTHGHSSLPIRVFMYLSLLLLESSLLFLQIFPSPCFSQSHSSPFPPCHHHHSNLLILPSSHLSVPNADPFSHLSHPPFLLNSLLFLTVLLSFVHRPTSPTHHLANLSTSFSPT